MGWHLDVLYLYLSIALHQHVQTVCGQLSRISDSEACVCPGDIVEYQCTIMNGNYGEATVFSAKPSSFSGCEGEDTQLALSHSQFNQSVNRRCNNGSVVGQSLSFNVINGTYSSKLNIIVTPELIWDTIECLHDNGTQSTRLVGESPIYNTSLFSPIKLYLSKVNFRINQITFKWNSFAPDCPAVRYNIQASNCGSCPTTTNHTTVTCTDVPTDGILCVFSVESVICENILTNWKETLNITLISSSAIMEKGLLSALISTDIILLLVIISLLCYIILITKRKRSQACINNPIQTPNPYCSTSDKVKNASYEDVTKVFDNQSMGTYGPLEYEEPFKTKGLNMSKNIKA